MGNLKDKFNDILLYSFSFISLILITILLSSSKNISYNIDEIKKNVNLDKEIKQVEIVKTAENEFNEIREQIRREIKKNEEENIIKPSKLSEQKITSVKKVTKKAYYIVQKGDTLWRISRKYSIDINTLVRINKIKNSWFLRVGKKIYLSKNITIQKKENYKEQNYRKRLFASKKFKFIWPLRGKVTSEFGVRRSPYSKKMEFHTGVDIGVPVGKKIRAAEAGKILFSGTKGGYGLTIIIRHKKGYKTLYGHCLISYVRRGTYVKKGQIIGRVGMTGITTGPHIHFEIRKNNVAIDPFSLINKRYLYY